MTVGGNSESSCRQAPITLKTYAPPASIKATKPKTISLADRTFMELMDVLPPNHITICRRDQKPQVYIQSPAPPTLDALLRPSFVTAPDMSNLLPNSGQYIAVPQDTTPSRNSRSTSTSTGRPTAYDVHLSEDLRLRSVAPMPPGTMETMVRRWRELVRLANDNIPTTESWPDIIGSWAGTADEASGKMSGELGMQATFVSLFKPVLEAVIGRIILAAVTEGTPCNWNGEPRDWTTARLPGLPVVTIVQKGATAARDTGLADYRPTVDNRMRATADSMIVWGLPDNSSMLLKSGTSTLRWYFRDDLYEPSRRLLIVVKEKMPCDTIVAATTIIDKGDSFVVPETRKPKPTSRSNMKVHVPSPLPAHLGLPTDPVSSASPGVPGGVDLVHNDLLRTLQSGRMKNKEAVFKTADEEDGRRERCDDDPWRAYHGLFQITQLFVNEDTEETSKVTRQQISELIGDHQPPAPKILNLLSDDLDHIRETWREMAATSTLISFLTDFSLEFRVGLRDPESHTLYLSPDYLPLLHRLPPNTLHPVGDGFEMEVCLHGHFVAWITQHIEDMPKQVYLDEPEEDGTAVHLFEILAATTYEAMQLRLIKEEARGSPSSEVSRTTEADIARLKSGFQVDTKPETEESDEFAISKAEELEELVKNRRKSLDASRVDFLQLYLDIRSESKQPAGPGLGNAIRPPSPGGHPGRDSGADPHEDRVNGGGQLDREGSTRPAGNALGFGRQHGTANESQIMRDIFHGFTPFVQFLNRVATNTARFNEMALMIHDGHSLASPEPAVFERVDIPLPPVVKSSKCSYGCSSHGTENTRLCTCSTSAALPGGSPRSLCMQHSAFRVDQEGHKTTATESDRPADNGSEYSRSVLCLDARVRLGGVEHNHVWGALACLGDGVQHGVDFLAVKLALTPHGCEELENEAAVYAHLARSPLGCTLSDHVKIPRCYGLFRETRDDENSMLALVTSWELGARALDADDCEIEHLRQGVEALHARGVCHQDLAPRNVLLTEDGQMTIIDFGRAEITDDEGSRAEDLDAIDTEF